MSRILVIGDACITGEIGAAIEAINIPIEYAACDADGLQKLRMHPFDVVITSAQASYTRT